MRIRLMLALVGLVWVTSIPADAATLTEAVAVTPDGTVVVLSKASKTLLYHAAGTTTLVNAKVVCLQATSFNSTILISVPPAPPVSLPAKGTLIRARANLGSKHYFVNIVSFGAFGDRVAQQVAFMGVAPTATDGTCHAALVPTATAVGVALIR